MSDDDDDIVHASDVNDPEENVFVPQRLKKTSLEFVVDASASKKRKKEAENQGRSNGSKKGHGITTWTLREW